MPLRREERDDMDLKTYYLNRYKDAEANFAKIISDMGDMISMLQHENEALKKQISGKEEGYDD